MPETSNTLLCHEPTTFANVLRGRKAAVFVIEHTSTFNNFSFPYRSFFPSNKTGTGVPYINRNSAWPRDQAQLPFLYKSPFLSFLDMTQLTFRRQFLQVIDAVIVVNQLSR